MKITLSIVLCAAAITACQPVPTASDDDAATPADRGMTTAQAPQETPVPSPSPTRTGPYVATAPVPRPSIAPSPVTPTAQSGLVGEYRVAGIDGAEVDLGHAITVSITPTTIAFVSQCVSGVWRYRRDGDRLLTQHVPVVVCSRARYREELALEAVFSVGPTFTRTASNGIRFSGGGRTVTVFSQ